MEKINDNEIAFYKSQDGRVNIEVLFDVDNIWLTQRKIAELFNTTTQNITQHIKNIYTDKEVDEKATCKDFLQVQNEGKRQISGMSKRYKILTFLKKL